MDDWATDGIEVSGTGPAEGSRPETPRPFEAGELRINVSLRTQYRTE